MSQGGLRELIGKAMVDKDFLEKLFSDRPEAIRGYTFTPDEQAALDGMTREQIEDKKLEVAEGGGAICAWMPSPAPPSDPDPKPGPTPTPPDPSPGPAPDPKT